MNPAIPHIGFKPATFGETIATAVRVNRVPDRTPTNSRRGELGCGDSLGVEQHANLASEQIKKDRDAVAIRHTVVKAEAIAE